MRRQSAAIARALAVWLAVLSACVLGVPSTVSARSRTNAAGIRYYLALGDSLAQGMQPDAAGVLRDTNQGYADQLYARERVRVPGLRLVKLGCAGETTTSMLTGHGNADAVALDCAPAGGSQLLAAERFLHSHRGRVAIVTLDIGANDIDPCVSAGGIALGCVSTGVRRIEANLPRILRAIRAAAGRGARLAAMTLYDPFLAAYLTLSERASALQTASFAGELNATLARLFRADGFAVAHVDTAFETYRLSQRMTLAGTGERVPVAVARVCALTWMCVAPPRGPDIHADERGYKVIAAAFTRAIDTRR